MTEQRGTILDEGFYVTAYTQDASFEDIKNLEAFLLQYKQHWEVYDTLESLLEGLRSGSLQLWLVQTPAGVPLYCIITGQYIYPTGLKALVIYYLFGKGFMETQELLKPLFSILETFAKAGSCDTIEARTRPGFVKLGKSFGFEKAQTAITKTLNSERVN